MKAGILDIVVNLGIVGLAESLGIADSPALAVILDLVAVVLADTVEPVDTLDTVAKVTADIQELLDIADIVDTRETKGNLDIAAIQASAVFLEHHQ